MSLLRSLRAYIGLGPDEEYEDRYLYDLDLRNAELDLTDEDDDDFESESAHFRAKEIDSSSNRSGIQLAGQLDRTRQQSTKPGSQGPGNSELDNLDPDNTGPLQSMPDGPVNQAQKSVSGSARPQSAQKGAKDTGASGGPSISTDGVVRSLDRHRGRPRTITPTTFADSKVLADEFNRGVPIVLDLQGQGRELSRRLIDFASGACYVLDGKMEKVSPHVFLLTPRSAKVSKQDRRLIEEGGYDR